VNARGPNEEEDAGGGWGRLVKSKKAGLGRGWKGWRGAWIGNRDTPPTQRGTGTNSSRVAKGGGEGTRKKKKKGAWRSTASEPNPWEKGRGSVNEEEGSARDEKWGLGMPKGGVP